MMMVDTMLITVEGLTTVFLDLGPIPQDGTHLCHSIPIKFRPGIQLHESCLEVQRIQWYAYSGNFCLCFGSVWFDLSR